MAYEIQLDRKYPLDKVDDDSGDIFWRHADLRVVLGPRLGLSAMPNLHYFQRLNQMPEREREFIYRDSSTHFGETTVRGISFAALGGAGLLRHINTDTKNSINTNALSALQRDSNALQRLASRAMLSLEVAYPTYAKELGYELETQSDEYDVRLDEFITAQVKRDMDLAAGIVSVGDFLPPIIPPAYSSVSHI